MVLRARASLAEDMSLVSSTHITTINNSSFRELNAFFWPQQASYNT